MPEGDHMRSGDAASSEMRLRDNGMDGSVFRTPTWAPSPNISISPTPTMVAIDNNGTKKKNAPMVPTKRAPEECVGSQSSETRCAATGERKQRK